MEKGKVYITQDNRKNYTGAYLYGEPIFITSHEYQGIRNSDKDTGICSRIAQVVANYDTKKDFVLMSGDPIIIALTIHAMLSEHSTINILKWSSQDKVYQPITIED